MSEVVRLTVSDTIAAKYDGMEKMRALMDKLSSYDGSVRAIIRDVSLLDISLSMEIGDRITLNFNDDFKKLKERMDKLSSYQEEAYALLDDMEILRAKLEAELNRPRDSSGVTPQS